MSLLSDLTTAALSILRTVSLIVGSIVGTILICLIIWRAGSYAAFQLVWLFVRPSPARQQTMSASELAKSRQGAKIVGGVVTLPVTFAFLMPNLGSAGEELETVWGFFGIVVKSVVEALLLLWILGMLGTLAVAVQRWLEARRGPGGAAGASGLGQGGEKADLLG